MKGFLHAESNRKETVQHLQLQQQPNSACDVVGESSNNNNETETHAHTAQVVEQNSCFNIKQ